MSRTSDKSDSGASSRKLGGGWEPRVYGRAAAAGFAGAAAGLLAVVFLAFWFSPLSPLAMVWLGIVPIQVMALAAAIIVLMQEFPGDSLFQVVDLRLSGVFTISFLKKCFLTFVVSYPAVSAVFMLTAGLYFLFAGRPPRPSPVIQLISRGDGIWFLTSVVLTTVLFVPLAEEILFRTVLFEAILPAGRRRAAMITSLIFAIVHQVPEQIPALFVLGMILQKARWRRGTLAAPIFIHSAFNALSLCLVLVSPDIL